MTEDTRRHALDISEHLFHLTTESLRLHSNETQRHQTLASLVNSRASARRAGATQNSDTIRKHLVTIPTKGSIRIYLSISKTSAESFAEVKERLAEQLGSSVTVGDALSVLLFDYVVELKAARVLKKLAMDDLFDPCGAQAATNGKVS